MSESYQKLIKTLQSLFEMDKADLDFGIYRIMNQKRDEINRFLETDLLPQVQQAFADYAQSGQQELQQALQAAIEQAKSFGAPDPEKTEPVLAIKEKIKNSVDIAVIENEIYSHLNTFFSRYYDKGDFISQRRYKKDTYAIPYEGEEVKLYWANQDQYYIKSSEQLRDYAFLAHADGDKTVRIKLLEADTEKDNIKAQSGQERRFVLDADNPLSVVDGELRIHFNYIPAGKLKQDVLNKKAVETILSQTDYADWISVLKALRPTEKNPKRTLLEKHLNNYTARNTFDYFIHKDLGGFFSRELDFYIKNEVLFLDDIDDASFNVTEQHLRKIKVLRSIAHKLIRMLAQLEDFQKKMWLKKKFVVETNYCLTLDRVPDSLYAAIAANPLQWQQWRDLGMLEGKRDLVSQAVVGTVDFLREQPFLMVDTALFGADFKAALLAALDDLDASLDGLLIHGDNFQALNLLQDRYREQVKYVYIDPPYNTSENAFAYKNQYKHSSWASLIESRLKLSYSLNTKDGVCAVAIDDTETNILQLMLRDLYGFENYVSTIAVEVNPAGQNLRPNTPARSHDYFHVYAKEIEQMDMLLRALTPEEEKAYKEKDEHGFFLWDNLRRRGGNSRPSDRPKQFFPLYVSLSDECVSVDPFPNAVEIFPIDPKGEKRIWRNNRDGAKRDIASGDISVIEKAGRIEIVKKSRKPEGRKPKTLWYEAGYSATTHGTKLLIDIIGEQIFSYPKALKLVSDAISYWAASKDIVLDYFAGSGTTAHAVINLNREDNGKRKYILVEQGDYFDTVLKPRIQKVVYSADWKNGKATAPETGISQCFKYLKLESYEDTLNNLLIKPRSKTQQNLLQATPELREDYLLGYWLDMETQDSASLLNLDQFEDPFNYQLNIATGSASATQATKVDVVETFNYLLGLTVKHMDTLRGIKVVTGVNPNKESVLVIWRNLKQQDNVALEAFLSKSGYNPRDTEYDHIYVNGDHTLDDPHSKVKMIEIEFKRLMFDVSDV